ncbi:hypothetical protein HYY74_01480 [Candidatus Woesearchaeota archaeon]|nr:hypothetical protein [Candidatus Woesearchaeota archaeon]
MSKGLFIKVYSNLPEDIRKEIIVVVNDRPYSWNSAYVEVINDTELGRQILKKLREMQLI